MSQVVELLVGGDWTDVIKFDDFAGVLRTQHGLRKLALKALEGTVDLALLSQIKGKLHARNRAGNSYCVLTDFHSLRRVVISSAVSTHCVGFEPLRHPTRFRDVPLSHRHDQFLLRQPPPRMLSFSTRLVRVQSFNAE